MRRRTLQNSPEASDPGAFAVSVKASVEVVDPSTAVPETLNFLVDFCFAIKRPFAVDTVLVQSSPVNEVKNAPVTSINPDPEPPKPPVVCPFDEPPLSWMLPFCILRGLPILFSPYKEPNASSSCYAEGTA